MSDYSPGAASTIWCSHALVDQSWQTSVRLALDNAHIVSIESGVAPTADCMRLDGWTIPGIPNLHSHAHQRAIAGLGERATGGDSFWTWREAMYRTVARIDPDLLYSVAKLLYLEMLKAGYTRVAEFQYLHHDPRGNPYSNPAEMTLQCARAAADVGIGFTALPVLYRYGGFGEQPPVDGQRRFINDADGYLEIVRAVEAALGPDGVCGIAPHSLRAISQSLLTEVLSATDADKPVHIHIAEQIREVEECVTWSGQRPVAWLLNHQSVDARWVAIHATHMDEDEVVRLGGSGAIAGLCPTTEGNLGDGFFPALPWQEQGGRWGIGSDSHITVDPAEELRWFEYGQRLLLRSRNLLGQGAAHTGAGLLASMTRGGAAACGWGTGRLAVGEPADLVVLDANHPRLMGREDDGALDSWVFSASGNAVQEVVVAGRRVIEAGEHAQSGEITEQFGAALTTLAEAPAN